jgi:DNA polymerase-3 subunit delta'
VTVTTVLDAHPHAAAVLGAALREGAAPAHAYLLAGPAGAGKRAAARAFAAALLSRDAADPAGARLRVEHDTHPDLTWVAPTGAHEMLRRDVNEAVVAAAARTPFEASHRVFVLERAETMNDETANSLLKTLEEPPPYVVLLLLSDRPGQVLPTIASRCQPVRFDAPAPERLAERLQARGVAPEDALACARLSLGDGEKALGLALGDGPRLRAAAEGIARGALCGRAGERPWLELCQLGRASGRAAREQVEAELAAELELVPKKEHRRRQTEAEERARRVERRTETRVLDHGLQLVALWLRDLACLRAGAADVVHNTDRLAELEADAKERDPAALLDAVELVEETRARLLLNVTADLALEALAYRLEARLSGPSRAGSP